ncbi:MAG: FG-GAP repeat domain-containing protein [Candidatus Thorarchaeota archaeon]
MSIFSKNKILLGVLLIGIISTGLLVVYFLDIGGTGSPSEFTFTKHTLAEPNHASSISYIDLDGDSDIDILGVVDGIFSWWENLGSANFEYHIIADDIPSAFFLEGIDLDLDNDVDLVGNTFDTHQLIIFINNGSQSFSNQTISDTFNGGLSISFADINEDTYPDIIACAYEDDKVCWFENNQDLTFTERIIADDLGMSNRACVVDFDSDGDLDLIAQGLTTGEIMFYENDGSQNFISHVLYIVSGTVHGVSPADIDGDSDIDIAGCTISGDGSVFWLEYLEDEGMIYFEMHNLAIDFEGANYLLSMDFDFDGDFDIIASASECAEIAIWENLGGNAFRKHNITSFPAATFRIADLDGDGDSDILSVTHHPAEIAWFENTST